MRSLTVAALVLSFAAPGAAQTVTGTVRSADDGQPVAGGLVVLVDAGGSRTGGAITGTDGVFRIEDVEPGRYRLVAERIGYASVTSEWLQVAPGRTVRVDLLASVEATRLEGVVASGERRCVVRPEEGLVAQRLWDEARKALLATRLTQDLALVRWRAYDYVRELDPESGRVVSQTSSARMGSADRPYISAPVETLATEGFVRTRGDTSTYYAPDAEVLLSDAFLDTHCFRGIGSADGRLGLEFEPISGRRVTDIRGVLWMNPTTAELTRLEFTYTWLPLHVAGHRFGGEVDFERLPSGAWITRRWELRLPKVEVRRDLWWRCNDSGEVCWKGGQAIRTTLAAVHEEGGAVMEISTGDTKPIASRALASLHGTVYDSVGGAPLRDAVVYLSGTSRRTRTDAAGRYEINDLPAGEYTLGFMHPVLDSLGIFGEPARVLLLGGDTTAVDLTVPSRRPLERIPHRDRRR